MPRWLRVGGSYFGSEDGREGLALCMWNDQGQLAQGFCLRVR